MKVTKVVLGYRSVWRGHYGGQAMLTMAAIGWMGAQTRVLDAT